MVVPAETKGAMRWDAPGALAARHTDTQLEYPYTHDSER